MSRRLWSATTRLVAIHLAVTFLFTILVLSVVYRATIELIESEADEAIIAELHGLTETYRLAGSNEVGSAIRRRMIDPHSAANVYLFVAANGQTIAGNLIFWPVIEVAERQIGPAALKIERTELRLFRTDQSRWAAVRAMTTPLPGGERLLVGRDAQAQVKSDAALGWALLAGLVLILITGFTTGWGLSRFILRRIDEVSATARRVIAGDLSTRVPDHDLGNEFDGLAGALNAMFDRMEALVTDLRLATDSLAHDLRSPLTRLRNHLREALDPCMPAAERNRHVTSGLREADELLRILSALLEISRAEAGVARAQFGPVDLPALAADVVDLFEPAAEDAAVSLRLAAPVPAVIAGHRQLLFLALSNLIDNAVRFAPRGSLVEVAVVTSNQGPRLAVADRGPGVPAEERERVLQRFVRLEESRSGSGAGLGLALVAAVARMHRAELILSDNAPGLIATLQFPAGAASGLPEPAAP